MNLFKNSSLDWKFSLALFFFLFHFHLSFLIYVWRSRDESSTDSFLFCLSIFLSLSYSLTLFFISIILFFIFVEYGCYKPVLLWYLFYSTFNSSFNSFFYHHKYVKFFFLALCHHYTAIFSPIQQGQKRLKSFFYFILFYSKITLLPLCYVALWHWDLKTQKDEKRSCLMCEICFYIYAAMISQQQIL